MGIKHVVSLVDRQESKGVEGSNKQLLRHLKTLVHEKRVVTKGSDPTIPRSHDAISSDTGVRPFDAKFGSEDRPYLTLPDAVIPCEMTIALVKALDQDLKHIRRISLQFQAESA